MSIRLKDDFRPGQPLASITADWLNTAAKWLNTLSVNFGYRIADPERLTLYDINAETDVTAATEFSWRSYKDGVTTVKVVPGDIELGPDTVVAWTDIVDDSTEATLSGTLSVAVSGSAWYVWVNVDVSASPPTARLYNGASITALTSEEKETIYQKRICAVTITAGEISEVKCLQCGNISIPRA